MELERYCFTTTITVTNIISAPDVLAARRMVENSTPFEVLSRGIRQNDLGKVEVTHIRRLPGHLTSFQESA